MGVKVSGWLQCYLVAPAAVAASALAIARCSAINLIKSPLLILSASSIADCSEIRSVFVLRNQS